MSRQCRVKRKGNQKCQITAFGTHHVCIGRESLEQRRNNGASQKYDACVKGQRAFLLLPCRHFHPLISHETDDSCATCPRKSCAHVYNRSLCILRLLFITELCGLGPGKIACALYYIAAVILASAGRSPDPAVHMTACNHT